MPDWFDDNGFCGESTASHLILIDLVDTLTMNFVNIVDTSPSFASGYYFQGVKLWMDPQRPTLRTDLNPKQFGSPTMVKCGDQAVDVYQAYQTVHVPCVPNSRGRYLLIRLTGQWAFITRVIAFPYPEGVL